MFQILPIEESTPPSTPPFQPAATRRTPSFSSSSRSNSLDSCLESSPLISFNESPPYSPTPPLNKLIGIPFSWEKTPGIPKNHRGSNKKEPSRHHLLLPLPPAGTTTSSAKNQEEVSPKKKQTRLKRDPFLAALVECSKDDKINGTRSLVSDTFGLINMSISCKRSCAVSASIARLPLPRAKSQFLLHPRRHQSS
ncbi:hypothetical protein ACS0TY_036942 [Phlomoides rotata]